MSNRVGKLTALGCCRREKLSEPVHVQGRDDAADVGAIFMGPVVRPIPREPPLDVEGLGLFPLLRLERAGEGESSGERLDFPQLRLAQRARLSRRSHRGDVQDPRFSVPSKHCLQLHLMKL